VSTKRKREEAELNTSMSKPNREEKRNTNKTTARIVGSLILLATATYMIGDGLLQPILNAPDYLLNVYQNSTQVVMGVLLTLIDAAAIAAVGIVLFPILRKHNVAIALGYVGTRIIECLLLIVAGISSLSLITLSQQYVQAGAQEASYLQALGTLVVAQSGLAFQIAMIALGLGSIPFCYLLYRTRLIPRALSVLGLIGYAALLIGGLLELFGLNLYMIQFAPGALFELIFPIWLIVKGFNSSTIPPESANPDDDGVLAGVRQPAVAPSKG
jgi:uncharacterized protein DUF4386